VTRLGPYPDYRDASTQWLSSVPAHWSVGRLMHAASAWTSNVDKHTVEGQRPVRLCNYTDVYKNAAIHGDMDFMRATASEEQINRFRIARGDTLITKDSETADDIGVPSYVRYESPDLVCGYHLAIVRPRSGVEPRFLYWSLTAQPTLRQWAVLAAGVTRVGIRSSDLGRATLALPPLDEQRAIADYLDGETAKIDMLIGKQEQLIATLRERRAALVASAVDHTDDLMPLRRYLVSLRQGWSPNCEAEPGDGVEQWAVLKTGAPNQGVFSSHENKRLPDTEVPRPGAVVQRDEIVMSRASSREWVGSAARVDGNYPRLMLSDLTYALRLSADAEPQYVAWALGGRRARGLLEAAAKGTSPSMQKLSQRDIRELTLWFPPLGQQRRIAAYLDDQTVKIDALIAKAERFIELAKERRAALITAAVTGQIDVRDQVSA